MRIAFLTHYYRPERGAPQTRIHENAKALLARGHRIQVVTGPPHYPTGVVQEGYSAARPRRETIDGVAVLRLPMLPRPNGGMVDRLVDQGSFAFATLAATKVLRRADVIVIETPPLPLAGVAPFVRHLAGRPYLLHVADPWPDFPIEMGALSNPAAIRVARALETAAYRGASLITTVSPGIVELIDRHPGARGKVRLLPNGVDTARFLPDLDRTEARRRLGWREDAFTVVYAGTIGLAQGLDTLLAAVGPMPPGNLELHVVGEGADRARLADDAARNGWSHIRFDEPVGAAEVPILLAAADAIVVMLKRGWLYDHSLPTKLVEGLAAGRPLIVSADGDSSRMVVEAGAGVAAPAEDPASLRAAVQGMMASPERTAYGVRAREAAAAFDRRMIVGQLEGYLGEVAAGARPTIAREDSSA